MLWLMRVSNCPARETNFFGSARDNVGKFPWSTISFPLLQSSLTSAEVKSFSSGTRKIPWSRILLKGLQERDLQLPVTASSFGNCGQEARKRQSWSWTLSWNSSQDSLSQSKCIRSVWPSVVETCNVCVHTAVGTRVGMGHSKGRLTPGTSGPAPSSRRLSPEWTSCLPCPWPRSSRWGGGSAPHHRAEAGSYCSKARKLEEAGYVLRVSPKEAGNPATWSITTRRTWTFSNTVYISRTLRRGGGITPVTLDMGQTLPSGPSRNTKPPLLCQEYRISNNNNSMVFSWLNTTQTEELKLDKWTYMLSGSLWESTSILHLSVPRLMPNPVYLCHFV